jgi:hypothetical protein
LTEIWNIILQILLYITKIQIIHGYGKGIVTLQQGVPRGLTIIHIFATCPESGVQRGGKPLWGVWGLPSFFLLLLPPQAARQAKQARERVSNPLAKPDSARLNMCV